MKETFLLKHASTSVQCSYGVGMRIADALRAVMKVFYISTNKPKEM